MIKSTRSNHSALVFWHLLNGLRLLDVIIQKRDHLFHLIDWDEKADRTEKRMKETQATGFAHQLWAHRPDRIENAFDLLPLQWGHRAIGGQIGMGFAELVDEREQFLHLRRTVRSILDSQSTVIKTED